MAKISSKNTIVLVDGYSLPTLTTAFNANSQVDALDATGFCEGTHNFIPGQRVAEMSLDMMWDSASNQSYDRMKLLTAGGLVTLIPEGYTVGTPSINMPYMQSNFSPTASPSDSVKLGSIQFKSYGDNVGVEFGKMLQHATIAATTNGTAVQDYLASDLTACAAAATLHVWTACASDTYAVVVQHSTNGSTGWSTIMTFTLNGSAVGAERQTFAAAALKQYRRVVATRTGAAGNDFGFSVHFWRDPSQST